MMKQVVSFNSELELECSIWVGGDYGVVLLPYKQDHCQCVTMSSLPQSVAQVKSFRLTSPYYDPPRTFTKPSGIGYI